MIALSAWVLRDASRASLMRFMLTGFPVSGSTSARVPVLSTIGGPAETTYLRFAAGRGRRKTDMVGSPLLRPYSRLVLQVVESRTTSIVNSTRFGEPLAFLGGHASGIRNRPRLSSSEWELASSCGRPGQFDPSNAAKTGSFPSVNRQRSARLAAETLIAYVG